MYPHPMEMGTPLDTQGLSPAIRSCSRMSTTEKVHVFFLAFFFFGISLSTAAAALTVGGAAGDASLRGGGESGAPLLPTKERKSS